MPEKEKLVSGTVTLHVCPISWTDKAISDVNKILTNSGSKSWTMKPKENKVVLKGKDLNVEKLVSQLKAAVSVVEVVKIEEDPKPPPPKIYTTVLKIEEICCEDKAEKIKSKLKGVQGIEEVTVDIKIKKVTVKSKIESKLVLEAAAKIVAVKLWPEEKKDDDKGKEKKDDKPKDKEKKDDAKKAVVQHYPGQVYVYNIKDLYCDWR